MDKHSDWSDDEISKEQEKELLAAGEGHALDNPDLDDGQLACCAYDIARCVIAAGSGSVLADVAADIVHTGMMIARKGSK